MKVIRTNFEKKSTKEENREVLDGAESPTLTPLDVLLSSMKKAYFEGDVDAAVKYAKIAAPYCHPRIKPIKYMENENVEIYFIDEFGDVRP